MKRTMIDGSNYWRDEAERYQRETRISCKDFHYGPLIPGDRSLGLLPGDINGLNCLEPACGGAQNSIYLAGRGARCTALDISREQLKHAESLTASYKAGIEFRQTALEGLPGDYECGSFDLVHSAYGLNFAESLNDIVKACAFLLKPGGILLFSLPHPLFSGEFLELDGVTGLFIENYFQIPPDLRFDDTGAEIARSNFYTTGKVSEILSENGFVIERICEPEPCSEPPYASECWEEYRLQMENFPATIIFKALKR